MSAKQTAPTIAFSPEQKAEHRRIRELFRDWHPSPEELIASGEGRHFALSGEYPYLRPFVAGLKQLREQEGLSLSEVSARCGIEKSALCRLENGQNHNPTLDTLWRYAAALGRRLVLDAEEIVCTRAPSAEATARRPVTALPPGADTAPAGTVAKKRSGRRSSKARTARGD